VGIFITRLGIFHVERFSGSRLSSVLLHWSFLHSLSWFVTDLCRRFTSAFKEGLLVIFHCLLTRFQALFHPEYEPVMGDVIQHLGDTWECSLSKL